MARGGARGGFWWALFGALGLFMVTKKDEIVAGVQSIGVAGREAYFLATLPGYAQPYGQIILDVANSVGVDPFLLFALGDRESLWGQALAPPGPGGTGDGGHGRGLMQIDDRAQATWVAGNNWGDPTVNIRKGAQILKQNLDFLSGTSSISGVVDSKGVYIGKGKTIDYAARLGVTPGYYPDPRPLDGDTLNAAALAAYNTGIGNVLRNLAAGKPAEVTSTGGDYATDTLRRAEALAARFTEASDTGVA